MAWNEPIGRPNCTRTLAYSTAISSTFCAPPTCSAASATAAKSNTWLNTSQPLPSVPINVAGVALNSNLACLRVWSIVESDVRVSPFALPSTANNETPLPVRAPTMIKLAVAPSITNILVPVIFQSLPDPSALVVMPFSSHLPDGSVVARVATVSPAAIPGKYFFFAASSPLNNNAFAASTTLEKNGAHNNARPISSNTTPSSMKLNPEPPNSSGIERP